MRVLQYALVMAVVLGAGMATAEEGDKPKGETPPWWLSENTSAKDQPQAKQNDRGAKSAEVDKKDSPQRDVPPVVQRERPGYGSRDERASSDWRPSATPAVRQPPKVEPRERLVYRLANAPASEVARTVNEVLRSERATPGNPASSNTLVLADMISNSLVISGTSEGIHETVKLVEQLDTEPMMVCVQAVVAVIKSREGLSLLAPNADGPELSCSHAEACKLIEEFSKSDAVEILARPQIMTLDNQPAFLQIGQRVPRVTSTKDGQVVAVELENVGLIVGVTPRISPDHVVTMEIDVEKSELGVEDEGIPVGVDEKGNVIRSPKVEVMMVQTTVKIPPSRAVIIGGLALQDGDDRGELVLVVTPHVVGQKK